MRAFTLSSWKQYHCNVLLGKYRKNAKSSPYISGVCIRWVELWRKRRVSFWLPFGPLAFTVSTINKEILDLGGNWKETALYRCRIKSTAIFFACFLYLIDHFLQMICKTFTSLLEHLSFRVDLFFNLIWW